jgi:hypothetical protein
MAKPGMIGGAYQQATSFIKNTVALRRMTMSNLETLDVGQANELKLAFRRTGWSNEEIKRLCEGNTLTDVRQVLLGRAEVKILEHVIDCDADPFLPKNLKVDEHQKGGQFKFDASLVEFYLSEPQRKERTIEGNKLRKELATKVVLNANVLDYLLAHPHLIPESWKQDEKGRTRYIFFWGTIYRNSGGDLCMRCLYWNDGRWDWGNYWLDYGWVVQYPAALRAS